MSFPWNSPQQKQNKLYCQNKQKQQKRKSLWYFNLYKHQHNGWLSLMEWL